MAERRHIAIFVGDDDYLVEAAAKAYLRDVLGDKYESTALETFDGGATNESERLRSISNVLASWQTPPFFTDPVKATWWRRVGFLPTGGAKKDISESVKAALEAFAEAVAKSSIPSEQYLLITAPRLLASSRFCKAFEPVAEIAISAAASRPAQAKQAALARLPSLAKTCGIEFETPGAAAAFIERVGVDTRTIVSELEKLRTWLGADARPISASDVAEVASFTGGESEIWELSDAVARGDAKKISAIWASYSADPQAGIPVAVFLEKTFREWIVYAECLAKGWIADSGAWAKTIPPDVLDSLNAMEMGPNGKKNTWALGKTCGQARLFMQRNPQGYMRELRAGRYRMLNLRERLTSARMDASAIEIELLRLAPVRRSRA
ncbi:MAG: hypothetical protein IJ802_04605 [Kiritimatiellae bacterium]|nr:hypothetical protein [Kiritimatiellia bacterium]